MSTSLDHLWISAVNTVNFSRRIGPYRSQLPSTMDVCFSARMIVLSLVIEQKKTLRDKIGKYRELKESSIGPPTKCLGGKLKEVELENGQKCLAFGSKQYVEDAVQKV